MCNYFSYSKRTAFLVLFVLHSAVFAQTGANEPGSWIMFFNQTRLHEKWSLHAEAQLRNYNTGLNTEQAMLRFGVNFHLNATTTTTAAYGSIFNYADDGEILQSQVSREDRVWEQLVLKSRTG